MEHAEYVYTHGMTEDEVDRLLRDSDHGVLALARNDDAYAVPLSYHYDGSNVFLRVSQEPESTKVAYLESTATATFLVYDADETGSWSIMVRGQLRALPEAEQFSERRINQLFPPFRLFDEAVDEVEFVIYELRPREITGRRTFE